MCDVIDDVMFDTARRSRSTGDIDQILESSAVAPKLEPAYSEPPFYTLQKINKGYLRDLGHSDSFSDSELECDNSYQHNERKKRSRRSRTTNPNELSLAQKVLVYKRVMAFKESGSSDC